MFDWLFGKKPPPDARELVWIDDAARWTAIARAGRDTPGSVLIVVFFEATAATARDVLAAAGVPCVVVGDTPRPWDRACRVHIVRADRLRHLVGDLPEPLTVCGAEQHPLPAEGRALVAALAQRTTSPPTFHASLDDPLLKRFGGDRIREMMVTMGMTAEEPIEHAMVSRSLVNARGKLAAKVRNPREAASMEEWFARNVDG